MKKELICAKCKYKWMTKSKLVFVSCPSCNAKVRTNYEKGDFENV